MKSVVTIKIIFYAWLCHYDKVHFTFIFAVLLLILTRVKVGKGIKVVNIM